MKDFLQVALACAKTFRCPDLPIAAEAALACLILVLSSFASRTDEKMKEKKT
jgi:hypothetical protein